ncbi:MAG: hypothetical protein L6R41_001670 [Letrouitia leprolyta]|nr:MAG: hypothetical protein L6R41_001670 [Letrouitia leprolyta]
MSRIIYILASLTDSSFVITEFSDIEMAQPNDLVTWLIGGLSDTTLDGLDCTDATYDLNWATNAGISDVEVTTYKSPYKIQDLQAHGILLPRDRLEFQVEGRTWTVELLARPNAKSFSVRTVAPSPRAGIPANNCRGF